MTNITHDWLVAHPNCPLCGSAEREPREHDEAGEASSYTVTLAERFGLTVEQLWALSPIYTCCSCGSNWRDPWLSEEASSWLYQQGFPSHNFGWLLQSLWKDGTLPQRTGFHENLWSFFRSTHDHPLKYAEYNCPFSGLAFVERYNRQLSQPAFLTDRTLIIEETPMCWGAHCATGKQSCREYAEAELFDHIATLSDVEKSDEKFDLLGVFHTFDHVPSPSTSLQRLLAIANIIVLEVHTHGWSDIQHLFATSRDYFRMLAKSGVKVLDITKGFSADRGITKRVDSMVFLISKQDDFSPLIAKLSR